MSMSMFSEHLRLKGKEYKTIRKDINDFAANKKHFAWLHGGVLQMPIKTLLDSIETTPVRTGHLGNWHEIINGRACALDHNGTAVLSDWANPLIFDILQTENQLMTSGDCVYLPGSFVMECQKRTLDLFTWNGNSFETASRENSYFVPFVKALYNDEIIPLSSIHKQNGSLFAKTRFASSIVVENRKLVTEILENILIQMTTDPNNGIPLNNIVDRCITLSGQVTRVGTCAKGKQYIVGDIVYESASALIEDMFIPFLAGHDPDTFFDEIGGMKKTLPFLSLPFLSVLLYIVASRNNGQGIHNYIEWGAFNSAAYPILSKGYYRKKAGLIGKMYSHIASHCISGCPPLFFLLLPSGILNMLPCDAYPNDAVIIEMLFNLVTKTDDESDPPVQQKHIIKIADKWALENGKFLSVYYKDRFTKKRCISTGSFYHTQAKPVMLDNFGQLSLKKASMLLGALFEVFNR